ncbi:DUF7281 domain-containing protein [Winogradskyella forsetii]|uniref:DUF7281 domain-containing protein n=1 Tax=Winogradskyella forsetii TaxID=2686077 RepID=UPI0015BE34D6|nr:hypothetical protein [Winogradskyella forsetii]
MILTLKIARVLQSLCSGQIIPNSSAKSKIIDELVVENIIARNGNRKKELILRNENFLKIYLKNQLQIDNLESYITILENKNSTRARAVQITSDSKVAKERAFKGFLVNSYRQINATLNNDSFSIRPVKGAFTFVYDYKTFGIPKDVTIVGVENAKNFSEIQSQQYLFEDLKPLFISRYPQNQNKDFIKWITAIPNAYIHYGDFDIAGIGIYLNEYKRYLNDRATFFIPNDIEYLLKNNGNRNRYDNQKINFDKDKITENKLLHLIELIQKERKGLDQEFFIVED